MSSFLEGPVRNRTASRVCTMAGLAKASGSLVTLRELNNGTEQALRELEKARERAMTIDNMLLVAKFTKATCDAFIGLASKFAGKGSDLVEKAYKVATPLASAAGQATAGQTVNKTQLAIDVAKKLRPKAKGNDGANELLVKNGIFKIEATRAVLNGDQASLKKSAKEYMFDLAKFTAEKGFQNALGDKDGSRVGKFIDLGKTLFDYNEALTDTFDQALMQRESTAASFEAQRLTILKSGRRLTSAIRDLEQFVESCETELQAQNVQPPVPIGGLR